MTEKSFTPVSIRRRSAAQECADAHTASAERSAVGSVELASSKQLIGQHAEARVLALTDQQVESCLGGREVSVGGHVMRWQHEAVQVQQDARSAARRSHDLVGKFAAL